MPCTVLVVDDSAPLRAVIRTSLKLGGYEVVEAASGHDALSLIDSRPVDVILSDINMPAMSGFAFLREVRRREAHKRTPFLLLTVESSAPQKAAAKEAGATGWITKPIDSESLLEAIARVTG